MLPPALRLCSRHLVLETKFLMVGPISVSESTGEAAEQQKISEVRELMKFPNPWDLVIEKRCSR